MSANNPTHIRIRKGWLIASLIALFSLTACAVGATTTVSPNEEVPGVVTPTPAIVIATVTPDGPIATVTWTPVPPPTETLESLSTPSNRVLTPLPPTSTSPAERPTSITFGDSAPSSGRASNQEPDLDTNPPSCTIASCIAFDSCQEVINFLQSCPDLADDLDADGDGIACDNLCETTESEEATESTEGT